MSKMPKYILLFILCVSQLSAQTTNTIVQNFNQSVNQIGDCWQWENMTITTKNTIFNNNQKKAIIGTNVNGFPAYHFTSPLINFNGSGSISFWHKLNADNGFHREVRLVLLDQSENVVQVLHNHVYIDSANGSRPNGNPTTNYNTSISVTFTGTYYIRWEVISKGGTSFAMFDNMEIDGIDTSDGTNDNGYGYCRGDDVVYDTLCAGSYYQHDLPYPISGSDWTWTFTRGMGGMIDSTFVSGPHDTAVKVQWDFTAGGDYTLEATEIRSPYNTTTYSVDFLIHVLPAPSVRMTIDTVCEGEQHSVGFDFGGGLGPWQITYTDGDSIYTETFTNQSSMINMGAYSTATNIEVLSVIGANGCPGDTTTLPSGTAGLLPDPVTGAIWHN